MPGHRDLIVSATLGIDVKGISGKNVRGRSGTAIPDPHRVAAAVEARLKDIRLGDNGQFILRETTVSSVTAGFNTIAEIARIATESPRKSNAKRSTRPRGRASTRRKTS